MCEPYLELADRLFPSFLLEESLYSSFLFSRNIAAFPFFSIVTYPLRLLLRVEGWPAYFGPTHKKVSADYTAGSTWCCVHSRTKILSSPRFWSEFIFALPSLTHFFDTQFLACAFACYYRPSPRYFTFIAPCTPLSSALPSLSHTQHTHSLSLFSLSLSLALSAVQCYL